MAVGVGPQRVEAKEAEGRFCLGGAWHHCCVQRDQSDEHHNGLPTGAATGAQAPKLASPLTAAGAPGEERDPTLRHVTPEEAAAAAQLRAQLEADPEALQAADRHRGGESLQALCVRFSRARPKSTAAAFAMLKADLAYREQRSAAGFPPTTPAAMLEDYARRAKVRVHRPLDGQALLAAYGKHLPHAILGRDRQGRVVLYRLLHAGTRLAELLEVGLETQALVRYNEWLLEQSLGLTAHQGQWTIIMDLGGLGIREFDPRGLGFTKKLMELDAAHYPERLGQAFIINAPGFVAFFWRRMSAWLDAKTNQKLQLFGGVEQWRAALADAMDPSILPTHLGGRTQLQVAMWRLQQGAVGEGLELSSAAPPPEVAEWSEPQKVRVRQEGFSFVLLLLALLAAVSACLSLQ